MEDQEPQRRWLDDFRDQIDKALSKPSLPLSPAAGLAREAFDNWWQAEQNPVTGKVSGIFQDPGAQEEGARHWSQKIEQLSEEKGEGCTQRLACRRHIAAERPSHGCLPRGHEARMLRRIEIRRQGDGGRSASNAINPLRCAATPSFRDCRCSRLGSYSSGAIKGAFSGITCGRGNPRSTRSREMERIDSLFQRG